VLAYHSELLALQSRDLNSKPKDCLRSRTPPDDLASPLIGANHLLIVAQCTGLWKHTDDR